MDMGNGDRSRRGDDLFVHTRTFTHARTRTHTHTHLPSRTVVRTRTNTHTRVHVHTAVFCDLDLILALFGTDIAKADPSLSPSISVWFDLRQGWV